MLLAVVISCIVSGLVAVCTAITMDLSLWAVLLSYPIGGLVGMLGTALVANVMASWLGRGSSITAPDRSMKGLQDQETLPQTMNWQLFANECRIH